MKLIILYEQPRAAGAAKSRSLPVLLTLGGEHKPGSAVRFLLQHQPGCIIASVIILGPDWRSGMRFLTHLFFTAQALCHQSEFTKR